MDSNRGTSSSSDGFPSEVEFTESDGNAIPWREVECHQIFQITQIRSIVTKNGDGIILTLKREDGSVVNAWTTKLIEEKIKAFSEEEKRKNKYIMSYGTKTGKKTNNQYYDFKILFKQ